MSWRRERISEVLKEKIGEVIFNNLEVEEGVLVTVTGVLVSEDRGHAKTYISVFPDRETEKVFKILERNIYRFQKIIDRELLMRPVPKIHFCIDKGGELFSRVNKLFQK